LSERHRLRRLVVSRRELSSLSREKTVVLALLVQLFVAAFSSFLVVGLTSLYSPGSVPGSVTVAAVGDASGEFVTAAGEIEGLDARVVSDLEAATAAFERGRVDGVVEARRADGRIAVEATAPANSLRKTLVVVRLRAALEALERAERLERSDDLERTLVPLPPAVDASQYYGFTYTVLVPLLLFLPVFISGALVIDSVTEERERGTLSLLRVTPLSLVEIVDGKALAAGALAPAQATLWAVLLAANGIRVANLPLLVGFVAALAALAVCGGAALSLALSERGRAQLVYSVCLLGFFTAGAFLPEHPATTAALLAIDSPGPLTVASVVGYALLAVVAVFGLRGLVGRVDAETL
jgi:ABC-type Na+ efflux pump permease subunit